MIAELDELDEIIEDADEVEPAPLSHPDHCTYVQFLAILVRDHGAGYLCRPDGLLLSGVPYIPGPAPVEGQRERMITFVAPQKPAVSTRARIIELLANGSMTIPELVEASDIRPRLISGAISADSSKTIRRDTTRIGSYWRLAVGDEIGVELPRARRSHVSEAIVAYLRNHGRSTTGDIAKGLNRTPRTVARACLYEPGIVSVGRDSLQMIWDLK